MDPVRTLDYARVVWRSRWWLLGVTLLSFASAALVARFQPPVYRATATVLAPRESSGQSLSSSIGSLLFGGGSKEGGREFSFPGVSINVPSVAGTLDVFVAQLRSRTLRASVLADFEKRHGLTVNAKILTVETSTKEKGVVALTVEATEAKLAADFANAYFEHLDRILQTQAHDNARRQERFYVGQLERAAREIDLAEDELLRYQTANRMLVTVDPAAKGMAEGAGSLRGAIMGLEMQREVLRMRYTEQHPQMREVEKQIAELKRQYSRNLFGSAMDLPPESPNAKGPRKEFFVSAEKMTPVQLGYLKLLRKLKIQEAFYTGALQSLQQIRYAEDSARPPGVEPLDPAVPPGNSVRPNVFLILAVGLAIGLIVAVCIVLLREAVMQALSAEKIRAPLSSTSRVEASPPIAP
jgi:uncharacterized protein involved in exopolysaccharide biosynthesis